MLISLQLQINICLPMDPKLILILLSTWFSISLNSFILNILFYWFLLLDLTIPNFETLKSFLEPLFVLLHFHHWNVIFFLLYLGCIDRGFLNFVQVWYEFAINTLNLRSLGLYLKFYQFFLVWIPMLYKLMERTDIDTFEVSESLQLDILIISSSGNVMKIVTFILICSFWFLFLHVLWFVFHDMICWACFLYWITSSSWSRNFVLLFVFKFHPTCGL